jgi:subtilisin family serine protease
MKPIATIAFTFLLSIFINVIPATLQAQEDCGVTRYLGQAYFSTISNIEENADGDYEITLTITRLNCWFCRKMTRLSIEADPGTYSNVEVETLSGTALSPSINYGPNLGGDPFQGFRINNVNGMLNGQAVGFRVKYTLSGAFQNQKVRSKAGIFTCQANFTDDHFQSVFDCLNPPDENPLILPYYPPLEGGKSFDLIGSELTSLYLSYSQTGDYISDDIFQIIDNKVLISVVTQPGEYESALSLLTSAEYGMIEETGNPINNVFTGLFPILNLLDINELPEQIVSASPVYSALGNAGLVTSQGDVSMRSFLARDGFKVNGEGVKIGVLSDSYNTILGNPAGDDIVKSDLPGDGNPTFTTPVDVVREYPYGTRTDEGRAMLQIIHDVAPGAELAFRTGFLGVTDFAQGILDLQAAGCDIIVDDITYISEPFFRDGVVAQAVETVTDLGVSYFTAAGNFGEKSWQGTFAPVAAPSGTIGEAHNFANEDGGNDIYQSITLSEGNYTVVLQWDDGSPGNATTSDFDIYLVNDNGTTLFGFNRVNTGGPAVEVLPFTVAAETANSNFLIVRESGSGPALLKYIVFRGNIDINEYATPSASTIMGQANAESAISVGAVLYSNTPEFGVDPPTVASFSSRGGTPVEGVFRTKPDITAPNGVNTSVELGGVDFEGDGLPNFFGTSAAAPHAAAVGALVKQAREKYYGDNLTPELVKGVLLGTALDMYTPGYDPLSGAGFIQADAALQTLANASPIITSIFYDTTLVPGIDPILLTVYGEFLTEDSEVWFNGAALEEESILEGDTAIVATIPPFDELFPEIQVYNPPLEGTNGLDGGLSNSLYFNTKQTILVEIGSVEKRYGEEIPLFSASYTISNPDSSITLEESGLSDVETERIYDIGITTVANSLSNVGLWAIEPDPADPLNPNSSSSAEDSLDISLLQRYNFVFRNGIMTINPLDLVITPRDTTIVYNDSLPSLGYDYLFNTTFQVPIAASDSVAMLSALRLAHGTALVNGIGTVRGTALVNDLGESLLDADILANKSFMISQALRLARGTALVNGELIDAELFYDAAVQTNALTFSGVSSRGTALVNGLKLARGTALVNTLDTLGNIVNTTALANESALINSSAQVDTTTINADSNTDVIVILGDGDIAILSGDSVGNVVLRSVSLITGRTVGSHFSVPGALITNNFNVTYGVGSIDIIADTVSFEIDAASLEQTYDGTEKTLNVTSSPEDIELTITYNGDSIPPVNAGIYIVEISAKDTNYFGSVSAFLTINPISTTLTAGTYVAGLGLPLPEFSVEFGEAAPGDDASSLTSLEFVISPQGSDPDTPGFFEIIPVGVYDITPVATSPNYIFTPINGVLYVNPAGPGTEQVTVQFICTETIEGADNDTYGAVAYFFYNNPNTANVYLPYGPDNQITGGLHDNSDQPILFSNPGNIVAIPYDGEEIVWEITSFLADGTQASSIAVSTNDECETPKANSGSDGKPGKPDKGESADLESSESLLLYPNPSTGKVYIQLNGHSVSAQNVVVFDNMGKQYKADVSFASDQKLEIDLSAVSAGLYTVRIVLENDIQTIRVVITE